MITSPDFGRGRQNSAYRSLLVTDCSPHSPTDTGPSDDVLRELLPEFFTAWDRDLCRAMIEIVDREDAEELHRLGHTIKGSMIQFGFHSLSSLGAEIMGDAERGDFSSAGERITVLRQRLTDLRTTFTSHI